MSPWPYLLTLTCEDLSVIQRNNLMEYPYHMKSGTNTRKSNKFYHFHHDHDHDHDTEVCHALKREIDYLIFRVL